MNRTKLKKKVYLTLALGLLFLNIVSVANAWGPRNGVSYRPLSDWTENNPRVIYGYTTNWDLLPDGYLVRPTVEIDQYSGYIREKVLDDGRAEVTVVIFVKGCQISLWGLQDAFNGVPQDLMVDTKYYCINMLQFILPGPDMEIPFYFALFGGAGEWISCYSIGFGSGTFTDYAETFGFTSGETGRVFLHQEGYIDSEGVEIWPHETINVY